MSAKVHLQENTILELTDKVQTLQALGKKMGEDLQRCESELVRAEGYSRRNNVRVTGLHEGIELEVPMEKIVEDLFSSLGGDNPHLSDLQVEVAHRVPPKRPPLGSPPRTVLVKFLSFRQRSQVLQHARTHRDIPYQGDTIHFYQDQTRKIQLQRMSFWEAKKTLRGKNIQYSMIRQATLRVSYQAKVHLFENPTEALEFAVKARQALPVVAEGEEEPGGEDQGGGCRAGGRQS